MPEVEAPIVAVTIYTDRAQVTRRGTITLEAAGLQELIVSGLPASLEPNSLRAAGRSKVPVTIVGVESKERHLTESAYRSTRELQEHLQALQDADTALARKDETLGKRMEAVQQLADNAARRYARTLASGTATLEATGQLLDFVSAQMVQAQEERTAIEHQRRENAKQQQALQSQIKQLHGARSRRDHYVSVTVEAASPAEFELELLYVVPGASWQPLYDARLDLETLSSSAPGGTKSTDVTGPEATLTLDYLASLSQNTGEDWKDVTLTLSTAQPSLGSLPPQLEPRYIDVFRPPVMAPMAAPAAPRSMVGARAPRPQVLAEAVGEEFDIQPEVAYLADMEATPELAEVAVKGATVSFHLPHTMSVPADGQPHRATIARREFPCRLDYSAVPERVEFGYLRATTRNESDLVLLPGETNVFRDGVFVGSSSLENIAPGQEFKLFLGPDEQVRTKRELTRREVDKNLIGNVRRHNYSYAIKLENLKPHRVTLTVLDQIPVSRHEQIKVKLRHAEPAPTTNDLGELRWELTLAPGSKKDLSYEYTVESPRDMRVIGLTD